jgi:hypothetical protein
MNRDLSIYFTKYKSKERENETRTIGLNTK